MHLSMRMLAKIMTAAVPSFYLGHVLHYERMLGKDLAKLVVNNCLFTILPIPPLHIYRCNSFIVDLRHKFTVKNMNEIHVFVQSSELSNRT